MGKGSYYVAQVEIPAREYEETEVPQTLEEDAEEADGMSDMPGILRTPLPLDTEKVTLCLFSIDGIMIR